jgi:hypothetical protein
MISVRFGPASGTSTHPPNPRSRPRAGLLRVSRPRNAAGQAARGFNASRQEPASRHSRMHQPYDLINPHPVKTPSPQSLQHPFPMPPKGRARRVLRSARRRPEQSEPTSRVGHIVPSCRSLRRGSGAVCLEEPVSQPRFRPQEPRPKQIHACKPLSRTSLAPGEPRGRARHHFGLSWPTGMLEARSRG